jgi:phosphopantothenate-cysteine ligase
MENRTDMNVVVSGGGTVAPIDDVRQITNISSGRFSAAISEACLERGAWVWHIHPPQAQLPYLRSARFDLATTDPAAEHARLDHLYRLWQENGPRLHLVRLGQATVADYAAELERVLRAEPIDVAFLAMAVSDFEAEPYQGKLDSDAEEALIRTRRTPKVIRSVRDWAPGVYLVGFKLLSRASVIDLVREAEQACRTNRADLTVANDLQTLQAGAHTIHLVRPGQRPETLGPASDLAGQLVDRVFTWAAAARRGNAGAGS